MLDMAVGRVVGGVADGKGVAAKNAKAFGNAVHSYDSRMDE